MLNTDRLCLGCMNDSGGAKICPICGYDSTKLNPDGCLQTKNWVNNRYFIGKVISRNGEGISYIGWDNERNSIVTVREYFPDGPAHRNADNTVSIVKGYEYSFNEGLMEFLDINRKLLKYAPEGATEVLNVFEENGTAFAIFRCISEITLRDFLIRNGGVLKWEQAKPLFLPLIHTIKELNNLGIIHRGISPETIMVGRDGKLRLTGISIKNIRCTNTELTAQVFPGYAAAEQYGIEGLHDDKYTDVYGLSATLFRVLIGTVPPEASGRLENDSMTIPAKFAEELPHQVLVALANGLQVLPEGRTKDAESFKNEIAYGEITEHIVVKNVKEPQKEIKADKEVKPKKKNSSAKYAIISSACTAGVFLIIAAILVFTVFKDDIFPKNKNGISSSVSSDSEPIIEQIGSVDSDAVESTKLYPVPDTLGKYYSEVTKDEENEHFQFKIVGKAYSNDYAKGMICAQSVAAGTNVEKNTEISVTISLGSVDVKIANVVALSESDAKIELLKQGFLYDNIQVLEKYDENHKPGTVLEQEPANGSTVNTEVAVKIYVNSYKGESSSNESSTSSTTSKDN